MNDEAAPAKRGGLFSFLVHRNMAWFSEYHAILYLCVKLRSSMGIAMMISTTLFLKISKGHYFFLLEILT